MCFQVSEHTVQCLEQARLWINYYDVAKKIHACVTGSKKLVQDPAISSAMATLAALAPSQDRLLECAHPCSCIRVFTHSTHA